MAASETGQLVGPALTNPFSTQLFGKADWWHAVLAISALSLAVVPIAYVVGRRVAREAALPPEAQAAAGS